MPCQINIGPLHYVASIGCSPQEQSVPQPLIVGLKISSPQRFNACHTDLLTDTIDVATAIDLIGSVIRCTTTRPVKTLEHLAFQIETSVRLKENLVPKDLELPKDSIQFELTLQKPNWHWSYVQTWTQ